MTLPRLLTTLAWIAIILYLGRRRFFLPRDVREDFSLRLYPDGDGTTSSSELRLEAVSDALARRGYEPRFFLGDEGDEAAPLDTRLSGVVVRVRDPRLGRGAVTLRVPQLPLQDAAWASVEAADTQRGAYEELALYLIYELGKIIPPVEYKRSFSSLSLEPTDTIEPLLPDRPHGLPR
jgi:hypothetical protein